MSAENENFEYSDPSFVEGPIDYNKKYWTSELNSMPVGEAIAVLLKKFPDNTLNEIEQAYMKSTDPSKRKYNRADLKYYGGLPAYFRDDEVRKNRTKK